MLGGQFEVSIALVKRKSTFKTSSTLEPVYYFGIELYYDMK